MSLRHTGACLDRDPFLQVSSKGSSRAENVPENAAWVLEELKRGKRFSGGELACYKGKNITHRSTCVCVFEMGGKGVDYVSLTLFLLLKPFPITAGYAV